MPQYLHKAMHPVAIGSVPDFKCGQNVGRRKKTPSRITPKGRLNCSYLVGRAGLEPATNGL